MHIDSYRMVLRISRGAWLVLALAIVLAGPAASFAGTQTTQTTTTTYQYNADGALTAVTTQVDAQPATTTYLTWDNFTPNAATPTTGTVSAANGNLLGVGASPGTTDLTTQFAYDTRDRLTGCSPAGQSAVSYAYYPNSSMASSTLASGDSLQFYYDHAAVPMMVNTFQPSTDMTSSFLGPVRYLSDGTEQVLLHPRKDVSGVYDCAAQTLSPLSYQPYGTPLAADTDASSGLSSDGTSYDLSANPFQYAGEYKDPSCDAYYLRARWYLPARQTFLSRDPADFLHRYSYTGGDPIGRIDPTGLKFTDADFSRDLAKAVHKLTPGAFKYIEPVLPVWGQVLGGIEMVGLVSSFWHHPTIEGGVSLGFLGASIGSEVGGETKAFDSLFVSPSNAFRARLGMDAALGASQTAAQSDRHGRLDVPALIEGVETTAFGILWSRGTAGVGYRPYGLTPDDVDDLAGAHFRDVRNSDQALVFRVRTGEKKFTSPFLEQFHIGNYHEATLAVGRDELWVGEVGQRNGSYTWETNWSRDAANLRQPSSFIAGRTERQLILVGSFKARAVQDAFTTEMNIHERYAWQSRTSGRTISTFPDYRKFSNNCQTYAAHVRANIMQFNPRLPQARSSY